MNVSANIALEGSALLLLLLTLVPMFFRYRKVTGWPRNAVYLAAAILLHIFAVCRKIECYIKFSSIYNYNIADIRSMILFAIAIDALSVIAAILCIFCDADGKLRLTGRKEPISAMQIVALVLPSGLAVLAEIALPGVGMLGLSYAVSLHVISLLMQSRTLQSLNQREEQLDVRQAKLLTEQMQPHFIFNSLSTIEALCLIDPEKAASCVDDFAGYLRGNIDALTSEEPIAFEKELEHIRQYVMLEQADPGNRFEMVYELGVTDFSLPALTVQPIVENAIKHGALTRRDGSGRVLLRTEEVGNLIRIIVEDNGLGTGDDEKQSKHIQVGMNNVQYRLAKQCGGNFSLRLGESGGRAVITLPKDRVS